MKILFLHLLGLCVFLFSLAWLVKAAFLRLPKDQCGYAKQRPDPVLFERRDRADEIMLWCVLFFVLLNAVYGLFGLVVFP